MERNKKDKILKERMPRVKGLVKIVVFIFAVVTLILAGTFYQNVSLQQFYGQKLNLLLFWFITTILALADSVNPCMISLLIIMIANLASFGLEKRDLVLRAGIYTFVCFLTYLLLGILIFLGFSYLHALPIAKTGFTILKYFLILALAIAGIINLRDAWLEKEKATFAIPERFKKTIEEIMTYVSLPATIMLAAFAAIVELPCTGLMYLGFISYLHSISFKLYQALIPLIYYNILFVLPEILITLFVWKGFEPEIFYGFYRKNRKLMRGIEGLGLLLLAFILWYFVKI